MKDILDPPEKKARFCKGCNRFEYWNNDIGWYGSEFAIDGFMQLSNRKFQCPRPEQNNSSMGQNGNEIT